LYTQAQNHLEQSKELNPNEKTLVTWLRKNQDKLPPKQEEVKVAPAPVATPDVAVAAAAPAPVKAAGR
jgi:suppressor of G2 allele of SKP1